MECDGLVRSAGAASIPIQYVGDSTSSSSNKLVERHDEPHQSRHHHHHHHRQTVTSAGGNRASSINGRVTSSPPSQSSLSRNMAESAEKLFREWDSSPRSRTDTTVTVRPLTVGGRPNRDGSSSQRARPSYERATRGKHESASGRRTSSAAGDSSRRSLVMRSGRIGGGYSSGDDSGDECNNIVSRTRSTSTRSSGVDSSTSRTFRVEFAVEGYNVDDIGVRVDAGRRLVFVHGVRRQTDGGRTSTTEFCRKIRLPDDVDLAQLDCSLQSDGRVIVEAPRQPRQAAQAGDRIHTVGEPLNTPVVTGDDRKQLGLVVEVGRLFRADDVVVKVKNSALALTVTAERTDQAGGSDGGKGRLQACVTWEFDLPGAVDVDTLRAGLTVDGLLRITARLISPLPDSQSTVNSTV